MINCSRLYVDIHGRWKKRNLEAVENMNPANVDRDQARELFERYADDATRGKLDELNETLGMGHRNVPLEVRDDFSAMDVTSPEDIRDLFIPHFYFGCEADDSLAFIAFNRKAYPQRAQVRAIMSFDLGHWDVTDMNGAAAEAYEQLEDGLIDEADFRTFAFTNSVQLYAGPNRGFFDGTRIEAEARAELDA